jgi:S1-C subfamily serine protease/SpoVK/Ycf46/Vps4 family AAA+-type ATPase
MEAATKFSRLITERIHEGLNFNRNHRFYLLYGNLTGDEFLTQSMYRASLRWTLWATLKASQFKRVIFYSAAEKFFFIDEESARLAKRLGSPAEKAQPQSGLNGCTRAQAGPLSRRNVLRDGARVVTPSTQDESNAARRAAQGQPEDSNGASGKPTWTRGGGKRQEIIRMAGGRGVVMSEAAVLTTFNDLMHDGDVRTAIVVEDMENLPRFDSRLKDQLAARLAEWNGMEAANRNVLVFITSREPVDERSVDDMKRVSGEYAEIANLINVALGEQRTQGEGFVWYVPPPYEPEITRLLEEIRLKYDVPIDRRHHARLVRWLAAENRSFRDLDGIFREYAEQSSTSARDPSETISPETARRRGWVASDADPRPATERLEQMIGMRRVKEEVRKHISVLRAEQSIRAQNPGRAARPMNLHMELTGNPGTGKTMVARLVGEIYREIGLLRRGHTVECSNAGALVGQYVGETAQKTNTLINRALDGILFIDEAYALQSEGTAMYGQEAVNTLIARMENERSRLAVIVAGYPAEMRTFMTSNPGLSGRFLTKIPIDDYAPDELMQIFVQMIEEHGRTVGDETREVMRGLFTRMYEVRGDKKYFDLDEKGKSAYANARTVRNLVDGMLMEQAHRLDGQVSPEVIADDIPQDFRKFLGTVQQREDGAAHVNELMAELDALIGLGKVKEIVEGIVIEQRLAVELGRDLTGTGKTRHMLFIGNPGTGKTTVARLVGRLYKALGILGSGHFVECDGSRLVGQYLGQAAQKTNELIDSALDGVLFLDEAYSLSRDERDIYGRQVIDTIVSALENHRNRLVVIFAGYTKEMQTFLAANSGIESRIGYTVEFPDYTGDELLKIFDAMAVRGGYATPEEVRRELLRQFEWVAASAGQRFGNARGVRVKFYDRMVEAVDKRRYQAFVRGEDPRAVANSFQLADVPEVAPSKAHAQKVAGTARSPRFRMADIAEAQQAKPQCLPDQDVPGLAGQSLGFIKTEDGSGTGFIISPAGHVLTAYHVIAGASAITFRPSNSLPPVEAVYLEGDEESDLAILKIDGNDWPFAKLAAPGFELRLGMSLGLLGYPMGEAFGAEFTYTGGPLSSIRKLPEGVSIFQIDVSAYAGNSGGPVFLAQTGEVIGVLSFGPSDTMNFAISVEELYRRFK